MKIEDFLNLVHIFPLESKDPIFNGKKVLFLADLLDALQRNNLEIKMETE